jgi:hypothetical protein
LGYAQWGEKALNEAVDVRCQLERQGRAAARLPVEELRRAATGVETRRRELGVGARASGRVARATD